MIDIVARRERQAPDGVERQDPRVSINERGESRDDAVARARDRLVSYLSQAEKEGKSYEEAVAARKSLLQAFGLLFLLLLAIKAALNKDASWWRVPSDMLIAEDWDAARETMEILQDEETVKLSVRATKISPPDSCVHTRTLGETSGLAVYRTR